MRIMERFKKDNRGQGLMEYGLILSLVSVVAVGTMGGLGEKVLFSFNSVANVEVDQMVDEGYIPIASSDDLDNLREKKEQVFGIGTQWEGVYESGLDKRYIQVSDIDLGVVSNWRPIGPDEDHPFTGDYDGGGYRIRNMTADRESQNYVGLFGMATNGKIHDVRLENVKVIGGQNVGGIAGRHKDHIISKSSVEGSIKGRQDVGGVVGFQRQSTVSESYVKGQVESSAFLVGGIVGHQWYSSITNSYMMGDVIGNINYTGGLVGAQRASSSTYSYMVGRVDGGGSGMNVGSLIGHKDYTCSSEGSYSNKDVSGQSEVVGGLGDDINDQSIDGLGKTTDEMKSTAIYKVWDHSLWRVQEGEYPKLHWESK